MPDPVSPKPATVVPPPPPRKPRAKAAKVAKARPRKDGEDLDQLARRLEADWQTALRKHEQAVDRQFRDLRAAIHGPKRGQLKGKAVAELRQALAPKLKPGKGRAKDLRRVESALDDALAHIP